MALPRGEVGAGLLEPVAHQIGPAGHAAGIGFAQGVDVGVAQFPAHHFVPQKWRVAHDDIRLGPLRFRAIWVQQGVPVGDAVQGLQNGVGGVRVAVAAAPLDIADPDGDAGQFGGVFVDFQAEDVMRPGLEQHLRLLNPQVAGSTWARFSRSRRALSAR